MGDEVAQRDISDAEFISSDENQEPRRRNSPSDPTSREIEDHVQFPVVVCSLCTRARSSRHQAQGLEDLDDGSKIPVLSSD